jgi:hypothetical protein
MELPDDVLVAAAAALSTVGAALVVGPILQADVSVFVELAPLYVYFAYLFTRRASLPAALDTARTWAALSAVVALGVIVYAVL